MPNPQRRPTINPKNNNNKKKKVQKKKFQSDYRGLKVAPDKAHKLFGAPL